MAAPKTVLTYPLDGTNREFTIPFEYLARKFIVVTLIGKNRQVLTLNSDYRFTSRTAITTTKAWGPGDLFTSLELRRVTSATERLVDFADGSILRAYDLNTSQVQSLHIAEEARDLTADTIAVNNDGDLDARGRKIVNVGDGILDGDAVNMGQNRRWADSALNQANRAQAEANRGEAEADRSTAYANESARHSGNSAGSAAASENSAVRSYLDANRAKQEADNSGLYNAQSGRYAAEAKVWAQNPEDSPAQAGVYSALHYAAKSGKSATASATSALQSYTDANRAKGEADRAKTEADKLGNANVFMGTLESVTSPWVTWKDPWGLAAKRVGMDEIHPFSGGAVVVSGPGLSVGAAIYAGGAISSEGTIYAKGHIDSNTGIYDNGQRVWSPLNFDPVVKQNAHDGTQGAPLLFSNVNPWGQTPTVKNYVASIELREAKLVNTQSGGLDEFSPSILFHYGGYNLMKLRMPTHKRLQYGVEGAYSDVAFRGTKFLKVWEGPAMVGVGAVATLNRDVRGRTIFVQWYVGAAGLLFCPVEVPAVDDVPFAMSLTNAWINFKVTNGGTTLTVVNGGGWTAGGGPTNISINAPYHES